MNAPTNQPDELLLQATDLHKHYRMGSQDLHILRGVDLTIKRGQWLTVLGASGSGKSTLLHLIGGLDRPSRGQIIFQKQELANKSAAWMDRYRRSRVGFVFQSYHLLPEFTAIENVLMAARIACPIWRWPGEKRKAVERATALLTQFGLGDRLKHRPNRLSGGERQRVAIARALVNQPDLLLADEPTGNLDADTGLQILDVLKQLHVQGQSIVMVTHDQRIAAAADLRLHLERGRLQ